MAGLKIANPKLNLRRRKPPRFSLRKRGRPVLPPARRRNGRLAVGFSIDDIGIIRESAKKAGQTVTRWVRARLGIT